MLPFADIFVPPLRIKTKKGDVNVGWAKYAEDNFEAFYERQTLKGGLEPEQRYSFQTTKKEIKEPKEESNFSEMFLGESCFSF